MTTAEPTATAVEAARAVRVGLGRLRRRFRENYDRAELTASQTGLLSRLGREGPASASELAAAEGVRPQSVAMSVAALDERGLVTRTKDPHDGRRQVVTVSPAGRDFLESSRTAGEGWLAAALTERLTEAECATVVEAMALLERVVQR
ncbi:MarR family winged helix-turn-helix transcriptional regulator [Actinomycetospora endophytica]|uniref:MarR family winged helix-turn-helix transcriptional regulator n=1 Tax=Actinomycetospora endophytica TaxID=2291215 RepID=A0ABS8PDA0_9PSEU|nr:MarR family winged helix-turn-helix transcriptional regulator [Actinomycetospora endophytica]MCD2196255.1 MarR family winged helix-turn-helix transcriptional regulator [Actinomycetospora endophytica]